MTTTENGTHAAGELTPEPPADAEHDWAQYAATWFYAQKRAGVAVTMDVQIASEIASTFEVRDLRYDVRALTAAIGRLEKLLADHTATLKAGMAEAGAATMRFPQEIAEDNQRAAEEAAVQQKAAGG